MLYEIKVTWLLSGTSNAACIGNDETVTVDREDGREACRDCAEASLDAHRSDWDSGKYDIVAEDLDSDTIYSLSYYNPADEP